MAGRQNRRRAPSGARKKKWKIKKIARGSARGRGGGQKKKIGRAASAAHWFGMYIGPRGCVLELAGCVGYVI